MLNQINEIPLFMQFNDFGEAHFRNENLMIFL